MAGPGIAAAQKMEREAQTLDDGVHTAKLQVRRKRR